jgi:hypothetical protein
VIDEINPILRGWLTFRRKTSRSFANSAVRFFSFGA